MIFVYLIHRVFYRVAEFFRHWYVGGFRAYWRFIIRTFEGFDHYFAWKITLNHFGEPMYGDYSFVGRCLSFVFRFFRLFLGSIFYAGFLFVAAFIFLLWILIIPYLFTRVFFSF